MARASLASAVGLALALGASTAGAEPVQQSSSDPQSGPLFPVSGDDDPRDEFEAFPTVVPHKKHYVRAGVEVGSILFIGFVDYLLNTTARGGLLKEGDQRWDLRYDWPDLRGKLVGTAYDLDSNKFNTNYISHPLAGTLYYQAARSSHLSFAESWLYTFVGSAIWEFFGEIRERNSVNDMIVTPVSGAAIGEPMLQLSGFFDRGTKSAHNRILSILFGPVKAINDLFDPAEPIRTTRPDALGFPTEPYHRFEVQAGGGVTVQQDPRASYADTRFGIDLEVKNLPGYAKAGRHSRLFDDGNVSSMAFDGIVSRGDLAHAMFATRAVPVGFYYRNARIDRHGNVDGQGALFGLRIGFEYRVHDYDRDRRRPKDLIASASPIGIAAEHVFERGGFRIRTALDVIGSFSGVKPYALSDYLAQAPTPEGLPMATKSNGYYHAYGISAVPAIELRYGPLEWTTSLRVDTYRAIEGLDEAKVSPALATITDRRSLLRTTFAFSPPGVPLRLAIGASRGMRAGDLGGVHASRSELSLFGSLGLVF